MLYPFLGLKMRLFCDIQRIDIFAVDRESHYASYLLPRGFLGGNKGLIYWHLIIRLFCGHLEYLYLNQDILFLPDNLDVQYFLRNPFQLLVSLLFCIGLRLLSPLSFYTSLDLMLDSDNLKSPNIVTLFSLNCLFQLLRVALEVCNSWHGWNIVEF